MRSVTLSREEIQCIGLPIFQPEPTQINVLIGCSVNTAEVNDQVSVDEYPHIVIAGDLEELCDTCIVGERRLQLVSEVEVMVRASTGIPKRPAVDGKESTTGVERRVAQIIEEIGAIGLANQSQRERSGDVDTQDIVKPLIKAVHGLDAAIVSDTERAFDVTEIGMSATRRF